MVWFKYLNTDSIITQQNNELNYVSPPLKKDIKFPNLDDDIHKNDWLFVENLDSSISAVYKRDLSIENQDHSYIVICENEIDEYDATPTITVSSDGLIFFKAPKDHQSGQVLNYKYGLYYGKDYLKYIEATPTYVSSLGTYVNEYIQNNQSTINYYLAGNNSQNYAIYSATPTQIDLYQYTINSSSSGKYLLNFFNPGVDWINGLSTSSGSKLTANFDGPNVKIMGYVGPDYGKLRYKIIEKNNDIENIVVDWTTIDCYSVKSSNTAIIDVSTLEYKQYYIEIETLSEKNSLSIGNNIKINEVKFLRNFNLSLGEQTINPDISFISIGGIR